MPAACGTVSVFSVYCVCSQITTVRQAFWPRNERRALANVDCGISQFITARQDWSTNNKFKVIYYSNTYRKLHDFLQVFNVSQNMFVLFRLQATYQKSKLPTYIHLQTKWQHLILIAEVDTVNEILSAIYLRVNSRQYLCMRVYLYVEK